MTLSRNVLTTAAVILVALIVLKLTKAISAPMVLALTLGVIVSPVVDFAARNRIPSAAVALSITFGTCLAVFGAVLVLAPAIEGAVREIPEMVDEARDTLEGLVTIGQNLQEMSKEVNDAISADDKATSVPAPPPDPEQQAELFSFWDAVLFAPQIAAQALVFLATLFFFILTRRQIYDWLGNSFPSGREDLATKDLLYWADTSVSRYFVTITGINAVLGLATGLGLWALGIPSAPTWGMLAFLLNYLLYLGPVLFAASLLVAGFVTFDGLLSYAPMAMYVAMNFTEGYFVTPSLVGHRLTLNPLLIFVTLTVWLWLWGPVGGIVALPVLVWVLAVSGQLKITESPRKLRQKRRRAQGKADFHPLSGKLSS
ncbi:AI-2E family transporter [Poseidonocella sp. HB161398]|uniref:AI-2E family transporter n=1 Tax=Poseidonocella sp. HB161398 TaxID=2320855 RepID=UPI001487231B|nr:AI-2E family transporter [Poseidonocella sp. HB161398]